MRNPGLYIVAGPNGSGKSLFSKELTFSDFEVFDGDKHMTALTKQYLLDNGISSTGELIIPREILYLVKGRIYLKAKDYPSWAKPIVDKFKDYLPAH